MEDVIDSKKEVWGCEGFIIYQGCGMMFYVEEQKACKEGGGVA